MQAQQRDELVFVLRQHGVAARDKNAVLGIVDGEVAGLENAGVGDGFAADGRAGMADGRADARKQLLRPEGLGQVIVRACVQRGDLVLLVAAGGDDDNGDLRPCAHAPQDLHSVHVRQTEIENDDVRAVRGDHGLGDGAVAGDQNVVAVRRQDGADEIADILFILDYEDLILDRHDYLPPAGS